VRLYAKKNRLPSDKWISLKVLHCLFKTLSKMKPTVFPALEHAFLFTLEKPEIDLPNSFQPHFERFKRLSNKH